MKNSLKALRLALGAKQWQMAYFLQAHSSSYAMAETGKRNLPPKSIELLVPLLSAFNEKKTGIPEKSLSPHPSVCDIEIAELEYRKAFRTQKRLAGKKQNLGELLTQIKETIIEEELNPKIKDSILIFLNGLKLNKNQAPDSNYNKAYWLTEKKLVETKAWLEYLKVNGVKNI